MSENRRTPQDAVMFILVYLGIFNILNGN